MGACLSATALPAIKAGAPKRKAKKKRSRFFHDEADESDDGEGDEGNKKKKGKNCFLR